MVTSGWLLSAGWLESPLEVTVDAVSDVLPEDVFDDDAPPDDVDDDDEDEEDVPDVLPELYPLGAIKLISSDRSIFKDSLASPR